MHLGKVLRERGESIDAPGSAAYDGQQTKAELLEGADLEPEQRYLPSLYEFDHQQVIARYAPRFISSQTLISELAKAEPYEVLAQMFGVALARGHGDTADGNYGVPWRDCGNSLGTARSRRRGGDAGQLDVGQCRRAPYPREPATNASNDY